MKKDDKFTLTKIGKNNHFTKHDQVKNAKRVEKAWRRYDKGKFYNKTKDEFLKELYQL